MDPEDSAAPGREAIDAALVGLFGDQEPSHWGGGRLPNQDGPYGISAYRHGDAWFYITYGMSELFTKVTDDPSVSGWGFELTMRVRSTDPSPPIWPVVLRDGLGQSVYRTGSPFAAGHRVDLHQPISGGDPPTRVSAVAFAVDPELDTIDTVHGIVGFLTVVGVTAQELADMQASTTAMVLDRVERTLGGPITDPVR